MEVIFNFVGELVGFTLRVPIVNEVPSRLQGCRRDRNGKE